MNYDELSLGELQEVIARAEYAIAERREKEIESLRLEINALIESKNLTFEEVFSSGSKLKSKTKVLPVYRDPDKHENTWTGRGRKPKWVVSHLEKGSTLKDLKI